MFQPARDHLTSEHHLRTPKRALPYEPYCDAPADRDDADLCAQWAAVQAVEEGNRLSRISLAVNFIEAVGLILSLGFTGWAALAASKSTRIAEASVKDSEKALDLAKQSAEAASAQVTVAQNTAKHQLRAYLSCRDIELTYDVDDIYKLSVQITNIGETPATVSQISLLAFWIAGEMAFELGGSTTDQPFKIYRDYPICLRAHLEFGDIDPTVTGKLGVICEIEYDDIFEERHSENTAWLSPNDFISIEADFPISPNLDSYGSLIEVLRGSKVGTLRDGNSIS